jgi:acetyltransferase
MSVRNLDRLFDPSSIALIGASARPGSVGTVVTRNLLRAGFKGRIDLVNPRHGTLAGLTAYPDVASLPQAPDLAIIATPPETVPGLVAELGARGTKGAVVITAGFGELGERGKALQQQILEAAEPHLMRLIGPNCVGLMVPGRGIDASR